MRYVTRCYSILGGVFHRNRICESNLRPCALLERTEEALMPSKYESQMKNLRKNYVRFPLDLKPDVLEAYKAACKANGTTPTTEIKKFIAAYIEANEPSE